MAAVCMIYGATGYVGRLIAESALARGLRPVLAGRDASALEPLAVEHQLSFRNFTVCDPAAMAAALKDVDVVLNAAGPFTATAETLARGCLHQGVHYLDISSELNVWQRLAALGPEAQQAGTALIPGAGFSPVMAEVVALHLTRRLPDTVRLVIALDLAAPATRGVLRSGLELGFRPGRVLRRGRLRTPRRSRRSFDFGCGAQPCHALGLNGLAALHRSTGVRNIDLFVRMRPELARLNRLAAFLAPLRRLPAVETRVADWLRAQGAPPSAGERGRLRSHLLGLAYDRAGQRAASRVHLPDPYTFTAEVAAAALARSVAEPPAPGLHSVTDLLGPDFLADLPELPVDWEELALHAPGELRLRIRRHVPPARRLRQWTGDRGPAAAGWLADVRSRVLAAAGSMSPGRSKAPAGEAPPTNSGPQPEPRPELSQPELSQPEPPQPEPEREEVSDTPRRTGTGW